jgi:hypothetical protein
MESVFRRSYLQYLSDASGDTSRRKLPNSAGNLRLSTTPRLIRSRRFSALCIGIWKIRLFDYTAAMSLAELRRTDRHTDFSENFPHYLAVYANGFQRQIRSR